MTFHETNPGTVHARVRTLGVAHTYVDQRVQEEESSTGTRGQLSNGRDASARDGGGAGGGQRSLASLKEDAWKRWREIEWDLKGPLSPTALQNMTKKHNIKRGVWQGSVILLCLPPAAFSLTLVSAFSFR